jgi:hypothetical protein
MKGAHYIPHSKRGFTPGQHGHFRPLVEQAWNRHCKLAKLPPSPADKKKNPAFREWYEDELEIATGKKSTEHCNRKRDFTRAMAHFETIVEESIYWQTRLYGDDARRIAWNIRDIVAANEVDEDYMRAMARRMLRLGDDCPLPPLDQMEDEQLVIIMGELKRFLRRGGRPHVHQGKDEPF